MRIKKGKIFEAQAAYVQYYFRKATEIIKNFISHQNSWKITKEFDANHKGLMTDGIGKKDYFKKKLLL